jgi:hypothetical protein
MFAQATLFVSSTSKMCGPPFGVVQRFRLPVHVVRLDTSRIRQQVAQGQTFKITQVPTLVVEYTDGNLQVFEEPNKIMAWLTAFAQTAEHQTAPRVPQGEDEDEYQPPPRQPKYQTQPYQPIPSQREDTDEPNETPISPDPDPNPPKSLYAGKKKKLRRKKKVKFQNGDEPQNDDGITFVDEDNNLDMRTMAAKSSVKSPSKMKSIYETAKQMEKDRQSSLGYREDQLPRTS